MSNYDTPCKLCVYTGVVEYHWILKISLWRSSICLIFYCLFRYMTWYLARSDSEFREVNAESLKEASRKRKGNVYNGLLKDTDTLTAHEKCNLEYKSSDHIRSHLKQSHLPMKVSGAVEQSNTQGGHTLQYLLTLNVTASSVV